MDNSGLARCQTKYEELRGMTPLQLVKYARQEFDRMLDKTLGKVWLVKRIGYLEQRRIRGELNGRALKREGLLELPETKQSARKEEAKRLEGYEAQTAALRKGRRAMSTKKAVKGLPKDEAGYRIGTPRQKMFAVMLKGGTTIGTLVKTSEATEAQVVGFLNTVNQPLGKYSAARAAVVERTGDKVRLVSYKTKDGKLHTVGKASAKKVKSKKTKKAA